jgi:hypothetical protein
LAGNAHEELAEAIIELLDVREGAHGRACCPHLAENVDHGELKFRRNRRQVHSLATYPQPGHCLPHAGLARPDGSSDRHDDQNRDSGGARAVIAESLLLKHQLLIPSRGSLAANRQTSPLTDLAVPN